ncbi:MAG: Jag N-terminal domain-containing protein [Campylobacterales bacterium]|nr:Jag N-terminal domain-containing protein [Campylobacterales bacterium]
MIKIEAITLEEAYKQAASSLECSVTELKTEVVQLPSSGFLGFFRKKAIIVDTKDNSGEVKNSKVEYKKEVENEKIIEKNIEKKDKIEKNTQIEINDTIMPQSFVSDQDEVLEDVEFKTDNDEKNSEIDRPKEIEQIALEVKKDINQLFDLTCFNIDEIDVKGYDENTLLIEFKGEDAALLIGKEGYRYKALSYMIFNWINSKYQVGLRLEIAEFLKNQEESVFRYLESVYESIDRDGKAQTKILDGVLVQIALKELRDRYPEKYIVIRSTRDGLKYIIINDYYSN